ncbi:MAG: DKNYY domain-containing protein [Chitinophagaceae bacterium]|nr:DKNYY domain-containing protein [Chitinophagaceae bacterium]
MTHPNKKTLKEIIDLETFVADTMSRFERDKNHVYYTSATSDGVYRFIVDKADPSTFKSITDRYGKDKFNVFYETEIVKNADLKTFQVLNNQDSTKDRNHIYYHGEKVE